MKKIFFFFMAIVLLNQVPAMAEDILVCGNVDRPPKLWEDESGQYKGIWIDLMEAIDKEIPDTDFQLTLFPWKRTYKGGVEGKNAMMGMFYNEERGNIFDFSDPVLEEHIVIAVKNGNEFKFETLSDLKGKKIGIYAGTSYGPEWQESVDKGIFSVVEDFSNIHRLKKILAGVIDGGVFTPGIAAVKMFCEKVPDLNITQFTVLQRPILTNYSHFAIAKKNKRKDLIEKFNAALEQIKASGEYQKIIDSYN